MAQERPNELDVFVTAQEMPRDQRDRYLDEVCGEDVTFRARIERYLRADEESDGPLDAPPPGLDPRATVNHPIAEKPGTQIGPFKLLQELGRGGMGIVYMAEQSEPVARRVALKIIKPGMDTGQVIARFEVERQALAMMDHPNIAKVLDAGATDSGRPYFVMELVKGIPITQYCDEQHLAPKERLQLFSQVCHAVQHAHQKGIIHRDIKPTNVLVAEYDQHAVPKIIDFGVAKATGQKLTEKTMFTQFGQIMGTLEYMSPEQAKLNQLDIDTRSDVYSLGVLLYELLTGDTPLDRKRLHSAAFEEMLRIIREEEPPKPSTRLSGSKNRLSIAKRRQETPDRLDKLVKGDLDWIAMKALEKDRARRYETASGLAADIERFLKDEAIEARPPSRLYRTQKFVRRNQGPVAAAAALILAMITGMCATSAALVVANRERVRANGHAALAHQAASRANASELEARRSFLELRNSNQQLRRVLFQDALAFGLSGDDTKAKDLLKKAKLVGATSADEALVRATLAMAFDNNVFEHLQRVIEIDPRNIPARVMLTTYAGASGNVHEFARQSREMQNIKPTTAEDYLFLGWLFHPVPQVSLPFIERARKEHDSGLARSIYARTLSLMALHEDDVQLANTARKEARSAQIFLGNATFATLARLLASDVAFYLARKRGQPAAAFADEGNDAASDLMSSSLAQPVSYLQCATHYDFVTDNRQQAELAWQRAAQSNLGAFRALHAAFKLKHYGPEAALQTVEDFTTSSVNQTIKATLCALSSDGQEEAKRVLELLMARDDLFIIMPEAAIVPLLLGDRQAMEDMLRTLDITDLPTYRLELPPFSMVVNYLTNKTTADELLASTSGEQQRAYAHYLMGMKSLSDRDRNAAKEHFSACSKACWHYLQLHVQWAAAFLAQMNRDPDWPATPVAE